MQALCFAASGWWQEEELGKERKHRWRPSLPRTGKEPTAGGWAGDSARLGDRVSSIGRWTQSERENEPQCEI